MYYHINRLENLNTDDLGPRGVLTYTMESNNNSGINSHTFMNSSDMQVWVAPVSIKAYAGWEATKSIPAKVSTVGASS